MAESTRELLRMSEQMMGMPYEHNLRAHIDELVLRSRHTPELLDAAVGLLESYGRVQCGTPQASVYTQVIEACRPHDNPRTVFEQISHGELPQNPRLLAAQRLGYAALPRFCEAVKGYGPESDSVVKLALALKNPSGFSTSDVLSKMIARLEAKDDVLGAYKIVRDAEILSESKRGTALYFGPGSDCYSLAQKVSSRGLVALSEDNLTLAVACGEALFNRHGSPESGFALIGNAFIKETNKPKPNWERVASFARAEAKARLLSYAPHSFGGEGGEFQNTHTPALALNMFVHLVGKAWKAGAQEAAYELAHLGAIVAGRDYERRHDGYGDALFQKTISLAHSDDISPDLGSRLMALSAYSRDPISAAIVALKLAEQGREANKPDVAAPYAKVAVELVRLNLQAYENAQSLLNQGHALTDWAKANTAQAKLPKFGETGRSMQSYFAARVAQLGNR